jgi:hypothetical protein
MPIQILDELVAATEDGIVLDASAVRGATPGVLVVNEQNATRFSLSEDAVSIATGNARIKATITAANFAALSTVDVRAGDVVDLLCHTTAGDGGGGVFDVVDNTGGAYVADGGTVATNGTLALVRRGRDAGVVDARWFGVQLGSSADQVSALVAALRFANGLPADAEFLDTDEGDHSFGATGRAQRPVGVYGRCVVGRTLWNRWRGVQLIGSNLGTEGENLTSCLEFAHNGHGVVLDTGDTVYEEGHPEYLCAPSLTMHGIAFTRAAANRSACLDGITIRGVNWFRGLKITDCHIVQQRSSVSVDATYMASLLYASQFIANQCFLSNNREYGVNAPIFWDLSDFRTCYCYQNGLGGIRIGSRGGVIESIDLEGQPADNMVMVRQGRAGGFYSEAVTPTTKELVRVYGSQQFSVTPTINVTPERKHTYLVEGSYQGRVDDMLPAKILRSVNIESVNGWWPPQVVTDTGFSVCHNLDDCAFLPRVPSLGSSVTGAVVHYHSGLHPSSARFGDTLLPAAIVGTVGSPWYAANIGSLAHTFTEGHIYLVAVAVAYDHAPPGDYSRVVLTLNPGSVVLDAIDIGDARHIRAGGVRQTVFMFVAPASFTAFSLGVYPYGNAATPTDYGAAVSPVFIAEVPAGTKIPQFHVPTLLRGPAMRATATLNGATPVDVADTGVLPTSKIRVMPTAFAGTPGPIAVSRTNQTKVTLTGVTGDTSSVIVERE